MHDDGTPSDSIGQRIARARKRRALTQHGLADRSSYSRSHIAQVEAGHKVATPAFIAAAAAALAVDPVELYGQPYRGETARDDRVHAPIPEIRRALAWSDLPPDLDGPPRPVGRLSAELATARRLRRVARHIQLGAMLPALIEEISFHAHAADDPKVWGMLSDAHCAAGELTRRLGYNDLSDSLLKEAGRCADLSQDPHLPLIVVWRRALVLMNNAAWGPAVRLLEQSLDRVDHDHNHAAEVIGALHLRAAIISGRAGNASPAWEHYESAVETSDRAGRVQMDVYGTNFVPGNIAIHGAAVATELRDYDEAVRRDEAIKDRDIASLVGERRAHHLIDMSRVDVEINNRERALSRLLEAEKIAPQMTRYHPSARVVARHLVDMRRELPEPLRGLQTRMRA